MIKCKAINIKPNYGSQKKRKRKLGRLLFP